MFSKTHRVKYSIIREAAGFSYGMNNWDYVDPREKTKIYEVMGVAGVNLTD